MIYGWIGKTVVRYGFRYARRRYRRPAAIAGAGLLAVGIGAAAYWLRRDVPEG
ncbi:MAG TPA: hypothetical protein VGW80_10880 [Solirubrobacterales bacterium]|jgi:hypothetical protein|nr:hypothetical protein [Solirubrobacterales bacterium]